jgi:agmatinase
MEEKLITSGWGVPHNFLGLPSELSDWDQSSVVILPVPYDLTTSYQAGGRFGPSAILDASTQVELYDDELGSEPCNIGIHTLPALEPIATNPEAMHSRVQDVVGAIIDAGKFPITLGGDHSITIGVLNSLKERYEEFSVLQLDAHADLRDTYHESRVSHACVARRASEMASVTQIGIRSISSDEIEFVKNAAQVKTIFARELNSGLDSALSAIDDLKGPVYLTLDVDVFDPSIMPATGTPDPGGLDWYAVTALIKKLFQTKEIIGCDVVELAPIGGMKAPDFLVAKLVYKIIGYYSQKSSGGGK